MSTTLASPTASPTQAKAGCIGYLAEIYTGKRLPLKVLYSAAGRYIGTSDEEGPVSRESVEYFRSLRAAEFALLTGRWQQRTSA